MIYFERPFVRISWNEVVPCVEGEWLGFAFGDPYRESLEKLLELHTQKRSSKSLADMRNAGVLVDEDAKWLLDDWLPRARAAGVRWYAVVPPGSVVGQMQLDQIRRKGGQQRTDTLGLETRYFATVEEARRWLMKMA